MSVNDYDELLYESVRELVMRNELDESSAAYGIAMQVVDRGAKSLSPKQWHIYSTEVLHRLTGDASPRFYDPLRR